MCVYIIYYVKGLVTKSIFRPKDVRSTKENMCSKSRQGLFFRQLLCESVISVQWQGPRMGRGLGGLWPPTFLPNQNKIKRAYQKVAVTGELFLVGGICRVLGMTYSISIWRIWYQCMCLEKPNVEISFCQYWIVYFGLLIYA